MSQTTGSIYSENDDSELQQIINLDTKERGNRVCYAFVCLSSCVISFIGGYLVKQYYVTDCVSDGSL